MTGALCPYRGSNRNTARHGVGVTGAVPQRGLDGVIRASNGTAPSCADRQMLAKTLGAHFWSTLIQNKCPNTLSCEPVPRSTITLPRIIPLGRLYFYLITPLPHPDKPSQFYPRRRTSSGCPPRSVSWQQRTNAAQQKRNLFDHLVGAGIAYDHRLGATRREIRTLFRVSLACCAPPERFRQKDVLR